MSYDVSLMIGEVEIIDCGNYTCNVRDMLKEALGIPFISLNDMRAREAIPILENAIERMMIEPEKYQSMNPENGWGKYEGALAFLKTIFKNAKTLPDTIIQIT